MTLVLDASSGNRQSNVSPLTWAHTVSGSNTILVMGFFTDNDTTATATFNGVSMTGLTPLVCESNTVLIIFYLIAPAAGTHNIVVTYAHGADVAGMAQSWTGAKQSGQFDNSTTNTAGSGTTTGTLTTVADNCVCMAFFRENQPSTNWSAGTNSTTIPNTNSGGLEAADFFGGYYTNFLTHPAGSVSMSASCTGNQGNVYMVSIAPTTDSPSSSISSSVSSSISSSPSVSISSSISSSVSPSTSPSSSVSSSVSPSSSLSPSVSTSISSSVSSSVSPSTSISSSVSTSPSSSVSSSVSPSSSISSSMSPSPSVSSSVSTSPSPATWVNRTRTASPTWINRTRQH